MPSILLTPLLQGSSWRRPARFLSGTAYTTLTGIGEGIGSISHQGTATLAAPQLAGIWAARVSGTGPQTLIWTPRKGDWMVVVVNRDATTGLTVQASAGAAVPVLRWIAGGLLGGGVLMALDGVLLIVLPVYRSSAPVPAGPGPPVRRGTGQTS